MLLGSNIQWVDGGDGLVATQPSQQRFAKSVWEAASAMRPTTLRYPGGSQSDTYRWQAGVSVPRGRNASFFGNQDQEVLFGTDEFLSFAGSLGAKPMLTVNVGTGTADDAAEWIRYVNGPKPEADGVTLPRVDWWELGNEPYLKTDQHPDLDMTPEDYALKANEFIPAMRAADPSILIGVPLRNDLIGGRPATPFPGFDRTVLRDIKERFDFVAVHEAYAPDAFDGRYSDSDLFLALMAAPLQVSDQLAVTRAAVRGALGHDLPIAITEWSALFTINGDRDSYVASLAGALYAGDLIRVLAREPNLLAAHYWSLTGNGYFGAVSNRGRKRPIYYMMMALNEALAGRVLPAHVKTSLMITPAVGFTGARRDVEAVTALVSRQGEQIRILTINKNPSEAATLRITGLGSRAATYRVLTANDPFAGRDDQPVVQWTDAAIKGVGNEMRAALPAHSAGLIVVDMAK